MDLVNEIENRLSIFTNLYDALRIIDPINKKTISVNDKGEKQLGEICFGFWEKNSFCENCISMRAFLEKDTCVKIEIKEKNPMLIIATPVNLDGNEYIVEMIKDISGNYDIIKNTNDIQSFEQILNSLNDKLVKDDNTGSYNKRYINERLPIDINNSYINKQPLSIIMIDIDLFKNINDTYGHICGDKVLIDFVKIVQSLIRLKTDWVARFGGEEFLVVLNNTDDSKAYETAEKIRKTIQDTIFEFGSSKFNITASLGIASINGIILDTSQLISNADKKLYAAKNSGRNKTII